MGKKINKKKMIPNQIYEVLDNVPPHLYPNSLPNDKIIDWSKFKAFADNKINENEQLKFGLGTVENIVGKGENAGYQHFLLFTSCFQRASFSRPLKEPV